MVQNSNAVFMILCLAFLYLQVNLTIAYGTPDYGMSDSESDEAELGGTGTDTHLYTTVEIPTQQLRGVPEDVKEFWGDQYIYISIVTVLEKEICQILNITMPKVEYCINVTTAAIETEVKIISNYVWKERNESLPLYQKSVAEKLDKNWDDLSQRFNDERIFGVGAQVDELRKMIRNSRRDISLRCVDLEQRIGAEEKE